MTSSEPARLIRPLPVTAILREAYRFTFTHLGAIMGLIWLPMVVVTVSGFFVQQRFITDMAAAQNANDAAVLGPTLLAYAAYALVALLLNAMMYVSVTQLVLGQRQGGALVHFSLGAPEWRMFRALLGLVLFLAVPIFVIELALVTPALTAPPDRIAALAVSAVILLGLVFVAVRFAFLLAPVVVTEDKPALARSWALSAGNFWRMLAITIGVAVPLAVVLLVLELVLGIAVAPHDVGATTAMLNAANDLPLQAGLKFLVAPFIMGLGVTASASAYRALTRTDLSV